MSTMKEVAEAYLKERPNLNAVQEYFIEILVGIEEEPIVPIAESRFKLSEEYDDFFDLANMNAALHHIQAIIKLTMQSMAERDGGIENEGQPEKVLEAAINNWQGKLKDPYNK